MPAATVCGSVLLNSASSALLDGSSVLVGGAPGMGGRRLKSGGITSGALVVTANSSGDFLLSPAALRRLSQPDNAVTARLRTNSGASSLISNLMALIHRAQHVVKDSNRPEGDRYVGDIEDIPVIAEAVKVEKVRHLAINQPVDQVPEGAADNQPETGGQDPAG